jgi:predicted dehydrogenase
MISDFHSAAISDLEHGQLVAVSSRNADNAKRLTDKYNVEGYADYTEMLKRDDLDIVCVCTPSGAHLEPAVTAAEAGKHVIVEKPLEITLQRCDEIIQACDEAGVRLCAIFNSRFTEGAQLIKSTIDSGRFGKLTLGDAYIKWYRSQEYYDSGGWRGTWNLDGGGALMNQSIHAIDLLQYYMGPVQSVQAFTGTLAHERIEVEDVAVAALRFENGALGALMNQSIHAIDLLQYYMGPVQSVQAFTGTLAHERIEVEDVAVAALRFENGALGALMNQSIHAIDLLTRVCSRKPKSVAQKALLF